MHFNKNQNIPCSNHASSLFPFLIDFPFTLFLQHNSSSVEFSPRSQGMNLSSRQRAASIIFSIFSFEPGDRSPRRDRCPAVGESRRDFPPTFSPSRVAGGERKESHDRAEKGRKSETARGWPTYFFLYRGNKLCRLKPSVELTD